MKQLINILVLTLALNFVLAVGGIAWLWRTGKLDEQKVKAIREMVMAPAKPADEKPADSEAAGPATRPVGKLDELLAKVSSRPAAEQVELMQRSFDVQMAQLDRRQREVADLQRRVDQDKERMAGERAELEKLRAKLAAEQQQASRQGSDKGFQDSLQLYNTMTSRQVKTVFMTLDDGVIVQYLEAMQPRTAARIIKEFKTPEEMERIQRVLEKMRQSQNRGATPATAAPAAPAGNAQQGAAQAAAKG
jgi:hypothetical protein